MSASQSIWKILRIRPQSAFGNFTTTTRMKTAPFLIAGIYYQHMKKGAVRFHSISRGLPVRDLPGLLIQACVAFMAAGGDFPLSYRLPHRAAFFLYV